MMNTETCLNLLLFIKDAIILAPPRRRDTICLWGDFSKTRSIKYKRWKLRYIPGFSFIFNGKHRKQHEIRIIRYNEKVLGIFYYGQDYTQRKIYLTSPKEVVEAFQSISWYGLTEENLLSNKYGVFLDSSDEEKKNNIISHIAKDLEESLEIVTDEDIDKFKKVIEIIAVGSL